MSHFQNVTFPTMDHEPRSGPYFSIQPLAFSLFPFPVFRGTDGTIQLCNDVTIPPVHRSYTGCTQVQNSKTSVNTGETHLTHLERDYQGGEKTF
jgi:hypothetical protein